MAGGVDLGCARARSSVCAGGSFFGDGRSELENIVVWPGRLLVCLRDCLEVFGAGMLNSGDKEGLVIF